MIIDGLEQGHNSEYNSEEDTDLESLSLQLAENDDITEEDIDEEVNIGNEYKSKRELLENTKISKQTWSILEIYQKIKNQKLDLNADYQRNYIWDTKKRSSFIESLFMGIVIPPVYVVEIPGEKFLDENKYEVVDGKQRLTTLSEFIDNKFTLTPQSLEYFQDLFAKKTFDEINESEKELSTEMLSSVLDIYVITANSPEFTKYDIFSRLNQGSEKLKVNEIRKAVYRSSVLDQIDSFVKEHLSSDEYKDLFTKNDIKRYEDYGRFYRSLAYFVRTKIGDDGMVTVEGYNSRPRDMINSVLSSYQKGKSIDEAQLHDILKKTMELMKMFKEIDNSHYYVDACIYHAVNNFEKLNSKLPIIIDDDAIKETLVKSASTTTNVNIRFTRIFEILKDE